MRFNRAPLLGVLAELAQADLPESSQPFAERLGQWLDFKAGLALFSVLDGAAADAADARSVPPSPESAGMWAAYARVRDSLARSIPSDGMVDGAPLVELADPAAAVECAPEFAPVRRYYLARQRDMSASIAPLRAGVRAALSRHSPALARLAALDAVLEQVLAARENTLLATVPGLLAKRYQQLWRLHGTELAESRTANGPERGLQPGAWLTGFYRELQSVLLAELELRLQPVAGLLAALDRGNTKQ